jgi:hypothetical protein
MNEFRTTDTQTASFLIALGHRLRAIEGPSTRREFVFPAAAAADRDAFLTDAKLVSARELFNAYHSLKKAIFAA